MKELWGIQPLHCFKTFFDLLFGALGRGLPGLQMAMGIGAVEQTGWGILPVLLLGASRSRAVLPPSDTAPPHPQLRVCPNSSGGSCSLWGEHLGEFSKQGEIE